MNTIEALAILAEDIHNVSRAAYRQARRMAKAELALIDIDALYDCGMGETVVQIEAVKKAFLPRAAGRRQNTRERLATRRSTVSTFDLFGGADC